MVMICKVARRLQQGLAIAMVLMGTAQAQSDDTTPIDYNREIRPILANSCYTCHGPDGKQRQGGLRLDLKAVVGQKLDSGHTAIVAGSAATSELVARITSADPDIRMPPADSGKSLTAEQAKLIGRWIDQGARWQGHWSFQAPVAIKPPAADLPGWQSNTIDAFILARLRREGLEPSSEASREALVRRVTLDLTGLPPSIEEVDRFLADTRAGSYQRLVERLLGSVRYGEHLGRLWLDAARYGDTHGLHLDNERSIWPYRDWVIDAFNRNLPFDQFTIEQLAGDLLPNPTLAQRVATGFNRCNVTTSEGGSINEEYYVRYAVDRVETTSTVWLGLTTGCAACHDHKYDPLTQKQFYELFSYFFSLTEKAMDGNALLPPPVIRVASKIQLASQVQLREQIATAQREIETGVANWEYVDPLGDTEPSPLTQNDNVWFDDELPLGAKAQGNGPAPWKFVTAPDHPVHSGKKSTVRTGKGITQHFFTGAKQPLVINENDRLFAYVYLDPKDPPETVQLQFNDGTWEHRAHWGADKAFGAGRNNVSNKPMGPLPETGKWVRLEVPVATVGLKAGSKLNGWAFTQFNGTVHWDKAGVNTMAALTAKQQASLRQWEHFRATIKQPALPGDIQSVLDVAKEKRTNEQSEKLLRYFLQHVNPESRKRFAEPLKNQRDWNTALAVIEKAIPSTLIMQERKQPRQAHILERGQYTEKREKVSSAVPGWLGKPVEKAPPNRLGLAQWLVSPTHPLTARVTVNRFWQHYFGTGLVKTSENFGVQGEQPSHPALLDWLAVDFIKSGWDMKRLQKKIVMSAAYRQSSYVSSEKLAADPQNRLLARGPRFRLDAEVIRDQALVIGGLLVEELGGKSVRPYQPAGLWKPVGFGGSNTSVFKQDKGEKLYRRSMYTFWKRTSPPPTMTAFDAPDRETCQVRRGRTNTPLQALVLMNDVQFIEAARKFAERVISDGGSGVEERVTFAFRTVLTRRPTSSELGTLTQLFRDYQAEFKAVPGSAVKLLAAGEFPRNESLDVNELGAWTMIVHLLLNLSETVTKG